MLFRVSIASLAAAAAALLGSAPAAKAQPAYSWNGIYIGLDAGYANGSGSWVFTSTNLATLDTPKLDGWLLGGSIGAQHQFGQWVLGIDGSWEGGNSLKGSATCPGPTFTCELTVISVATLDAKLGYASGRWLAYVDGGWAGGKIDGRTYTTATGVVESSGSGWHNGWNAGVGVDYALTDSVLLGLQYDHVDLGRSDDTLDKVAGGTFVIDMHPQFDEVKARLTWKLNTGN